MHHHNHNPVYFILIPSHDCEVIKLQNILLIFLFPILQKVRCSVIRLKSKPRIYLLPTACISTKTLFYITSICLNVCCCILTQMPSVVVCLLFFYYSEGQFICKCTNWSFEADMAVFALILCHYKFIYTPIIKVPSLFHGGRCVGSPEVAIHAYLC